jgi:ABC-type dipeptide/oligopeptide/nickel transport system permease subunit
MSNETSGTDVGAGAESAQREPEHESQLESFWRNFRRNRLSLFGALVVGLVVFVSVAAPVIAPYDPVEQYHPALDSGVHNPVGPGSSFEARETGEVESFPLGTDHLGRDILSRAVFGTRAMLISVVSIIGIAALVALPVGAVAGFYNDTYIDDALMRAMDLILAFPALVLAIAIIGAFGTETLSYGPLTITNQVKVILVVAIVYIPRLARVMRGSVISEMEEDYVEAAEAAGGGSSYILTREVMPNTLSPVIVQATLLMATAVLAVAGLSFLGIGILPPKPSLGMMLSNSRDYVYSGAWWFSIVPGLMILTTIFGFNLLGDGLRDALDPKYESRRRD